MTKKALSYAEREAIRKDNLAAIKLIMAGRDSMNVVDARVRCDLDDELVWNLQWKRGEIIASTLGNTEVNVKYFSTFELGELRKYMYGQISK